MHLGGGEGGREENVSELFCGTVCCWQFYVGKLNGA